MSSTSAHPVTIASPPASISSGEQVDLKQLSELAKPFFDAWLAEQHNQAKLDHEVQMKQLEIDAAEVKAASSQNGWIVLGVLGLSAGILTIAGYLFSVGRSGDALSVIQLTVAVGGAMFGGYGWARGRQSRYTSEVEQ